MFIIFYGLDWVATVPPTVALCREWFGEDGPIVFGWVFASHQIGAAIAASGAGVIRDRTGTYTPRSAPPRVSASSPRSCPCASVGRRRSRPASRPHDGEPAADARLT